MSDLDRRDNDDGDWFPLKELTPEEIRERLADTSVSWVKRTRGLFYKPGRKALTPQEENDAFEIAVANEVAASDGMGQQGLLL